MQLDNEFNNLILTYFPELKEKYVMLMDQEEDKTVDSYEFCIKVFLPYIEMLINDKNDNAVNRLMNMLEKMISSNDSHLINYGMSMIVEDIANRNIDYDYLMKFANASLSKRIQPVIDYFNTENKQK